MLRTKISNIHKRYLVWITYNDIKVLFKVNILNLYCIFLYLASKLEVWKHCFISTFPRKWMENFSLFKQNRHFFTQLNSLSLSIYWYPFILQTEKILNARKKDLDLSASMWTRIHSFILSVHSNLRCQHIYCLNLYKTSAAS